MKLILDKLEKLLTMITSNSFKWEFKIYKKVNLHNKAKRKAVIINKELESNKLIELKSHKPPNILRKSLDNMMNYTKDMNMIQKNLEKH